MKKYKLFRGAMHEDVKGKYIIYDDIKDDRALLEEAVDGLIEAEQLLRSLGWAERGNKLQAIIARAKERLG